MVKLPEVIFDHLCSGLHLIRCMLILVSVSYIIYNFEVCVCIQLSYNPFPGANQSQNVNKTLVNEVIRLKGLRL